MKKLLSLALVASFALASVSANAAETTKNRRRSSDRVSSSQSAPSASGRGTFGLGFQSISVAPVEGTAASAILEFDDVNALQILFGIGNTTGGFSFGTGAAFRHTLSGNNRTGLHIGGGLTLGTLPDGAGSTAFYFQLRPAIGVHFTVAERIMFGFEGGPTLQIVDGAANFSLNSWSNLLGLNVHYFL